MTAAPAASIRPLWSGFAPDLEPHIAAKARKLLVGEPRRAVATCPECRGLGEWDDHMHSTCELCLGSGLDFVTVQDDADGRTYRIYVDHLGRLVDLEPHHWLH